MSKQTEAAENANAKAVSETAPPTKAKPRKVVALSSDGEPLVPVLAKKPAAKVANATVTPVATTPLDAKPQAPKASAAKAGKTTVAKTPVPPTPMAVPAGPPLFVMEMMPDASRFEIPDLWDWE